MKKLLLGGLLILMGCSASIDGEKYLDINPTFELESFFTGKVKAWGIVQNRSGELVQRFQVEIVGTFEEDTLTLDETFSYGVGEGVEKRIWRIKKSSKNTYQGMASDIAEQAQGKIYGNAMYWGYEMDLPVGDTSYRVQFDDWIWAFDENTIMNRSYIKKFGITMAEVTIFMQKQ